MIDCERATVALDTLRDIIGSAAFAPPEGQRLWQTEAAYALDKLMESLGLVDTLEARRSQPLDRRPAECLSFARDRIRQAIAQVQHDTPCVEALTESMLGPVLMESNRQTEKLLLDALQELEEATALERTT